jgi:glycosyltransferase involved in cell wall biosynthesis
MQADAVDLSVPSGPQQHVRHIVTGLCNRGHRVRVLAIQQQEIRCTDDLTVWHPANFTYSRAPAFRAIERPIRWTQARLRAPFLRLFDSYRFADACVNALSGCDVLYERDGTMCYGGLLAARRLGIPAVLEVNGDLIEEWRQLGLQMSAIQRPIAHWMTGQIYRHASHLVAVGDTLRRRLIDRWRLHPTHVSVVRNGADVDLFFECHDPFAVRAQFGLGSDRIVMFTGSFQPWHGADLILRAFHQIVDLLPDVVMVFVGDGPALAALQLQTTDLGLERRVLFTGRQDHRSVAQLLSVADVAVIYHRGIAAEIVETPLKLFEYMAAGKAIVAPAVPNMERILTHDGNGILVAPDDPPALAHALVDLLDDEPLRRRLGQSARQDAAEKHSWSRAAREVESILYRVVDAHGTRPGRFVKRTAYRQTGIELTRSA